MKVTVIGLDWKVNERKNEGKEVSKQENKYIKNRTIMKSVNTEKHLDYQL